MINGTGAFEGMGSLLFCTDKPLSIAHLLTGSSAEQSSPKLPSVEIFTRSLKPTPFWDDPELDEVITGNSKA